MVTLVERGCQRTPERALCSVCFITGETKIGASFNFKFFEVHVLCQFYVFYFIILRVLSVLLVSSVVYLYVFSFSSFNKCLVLNRLYTHPTEVL